MKKVQKYQQLQSQERTALAQLKDEGLSIRAMARQRNSALGRMPWHLRAPATHQKIKITAFCWRAPTSACKVWPLEFNQRQRFIQPLAAVKFQR